eukprot:CAMPEP_0195290794 /NCGR_PEP_ID=MMETSP0707-20130614/6522_1 /TAXON_ID=33640 /ORGANISM="Asterionellopsis glacialis, Strain CCMP134" /LENGTH=323 /DNA_ID=CAMNT_0040350971 /DNA_START=108 /DNA_END=1079 /DNA_ORIENTATION=+
MSIVNHNYNVQSSLDWWTATKILENPSFQAFQKGEIPLVCIPDAVPPHHIDSIRFDATALAATGFGAAAGVGASRSQQARIRRNVVQTWLQSPNTSPSTFLMGDMDARQKLLKFVDIIRCNLQQQQQQQQTASIDDDNDHQDQELCLQGHHRHPLTSLPPALVELSYLNYEPGAYYKRHVDVIDDKSNTQTSGQDDDAVSRQRRGRQHKRAISMILFLGDGSNNNIDGFYSDCDDDDCYSSSQRPWDVRKDGGALRIHDSPFVQFTGQPLKRSSDDMDTPTLFSDIPPTSGTMVLFHSAQIPHEVLETNRNRVCVVAWFCTPV